MSLWLCLQQSSASLSIFKRSITGNSKNNPYYWCQWGKRITASLPLLSEGLIMKWMGGSQHHSWVWGILAHSIMPLQFSPCSSCPTLFTLPLFTAPDQKENWRILFTKKAVESLLNTPRSLPGSFEWSHTNWMLWSNTLWWNKLLCLSSTQYVNPGLIVGRP